MSFSGTIDTQGTIRITNMVLEGKIPGEGDLFLENCALGNVEALERDVYITSCNFKSVTSQKSIIVDNCKKLGDLKASNITLKNCGEVNSLEFVWGLNLNDVGLIKTMHCQANSTIINAMIERLIVFPRPWQQENGIAKGMPSEVVLINSNVKSHVQFYPNRGQVVLQNSTVPHIYNGTGTMALLLDH